MYRNHFNSVTCPELEPNGSELSLVTVAMEPVSDFPVEEAVTLNTNQAVQLCGKKRIVNKQMSYFQMTTKLHHAVIGGGRLKGVFSVFDTFIKSWIFTVTCCFLCHSYITGCERRERFSWSCRRQRR